MKKARVRPEREHRDAFSEQLRRYLQQGSAQCSRCRAQSPCAHTTSSGLARSSRHSCSEAGLPRWRVEDRSSPPTLPTVGAFVARAQSVPLSAMHGREQERLFLVKGDGRLIPHGAAVRAPRYYARPVSCCLRGHQLPCARATGGTASRRPICLVDSC